MSLILMSSSMIFFVCVNYFVGYVQNVGVQFLVEKVDVDQSSSWGV